MDSETVSQQPTKEDRLRLREKNMEAFRRIYPTVADLVEKHAPLATLVFNDDGEPDLEFIGQHFYGGDIKGYTKSQIESYRQSPYRLFIPHITATALDTYGQYSVQKIIDRTQDELDFELQKERLLPETFYLIVQGIGLAPHLDELVEWTQCRNLILMDANYEGFYHSLEVYDWEKLLTTMEQRNGDIFFFVSDNPRLILDALRERIRGSCVTALDGTYVYQHFVSSLFDEFAKMFNKDAQLLLTGLGFFYDEQIMMRNARTNLADGTARFYLQPAQPPARPCPAFVVGCGPSLDSSIQYLKENADRGVVISCGSALGPLMAAGIKPDFQIEMENLEVATVLEFVAKEHDISDICLVAASTVENEASVMFKERVFYHRAALCPYPIYSNDPRHFIRNLDPTVVNAGLGFVQELGFSEIYLFGVDMGQRGTDMHHAAVSYHYTEGAIIAQSPFDIVVPANFGGKARTTSGLFWAIDSLQRLVNQGPRHVKYFNCSNGALIEGIQPKLPRTIEVPELPDGKSELVQSIIKEFPPFTKADFDRCWNLERLAGAIDQASDDVRDVLLDWKDFSATDPKIELNSIFYHPPVDDALRKFATLMLRGTFNMVFIAADYYVSRATTRELAEKAHAIFIEEALELVEICRDRAIEHMKVLDADEFLPLERLKNP